MDVKEAVLVRRSIRAFRPDPVPRQILEEIMHRALWAPSWGNTQPCGLTFVGGSTLEKIREEVGELRRKNAPARPDMTMPTTFPEAQATRYKGLGKAVLEALRIQREDQEKRAAYYVDMSLAFGAPHMIYLHLQKGFNPYALMDGGIMLQTIALLAVERGLGTCFLAVSVLYPDLLRKWTGIPEDRVIVMGLAMGYPASDHPVNCFERNRGNPGEFLQWVDIA